MLHRNCNGAQSTAKRQRARIAHEDHGGRGVEPQEAKARPYKRPANHRKLAGAFHKMHLQIFRKDSVAHEIHDHPVARRRNHHRHDGQAIQPIRYIHRVACPHDDEHADKYEETAKWNEHILEKWHRQRTRQWLVTNPHETGNGNSSNQEFYEQPCLAGKTLCGGPRDLQKVIIEADGPEPQRDEKYSPDIKIAEIGPQNRCNKSP